MKRTYQALQAVHNSGMEKRLREIVPEISRGVAKLTAAEHKQIIHDTIRTLAEKMAKNHGCMDDEYGGYFFFAREGEYWEPPGRAYNNPGLVEAHLLALLEGE